MSQSAGKTTQNSTGSTVGAPFRPFVGSSTHKSSSYTPHCTSHAYLSAITCRWSFCAPDNTARNNRCTNARLHICGFTSSNFYCVVEVTSVCVFLSPSLNFLSCLWPALSQWPQVRQRSQWQSCGAIWLDRLGSVAPLRPTSGQVAVRKLVDSKSEDGSAWDVHKQKVSCVHKDVWTIEPPHWLFGGKWRLQLFLLTHLCFHRDTNGNVKRSQFHFCGKSVNDNLNQMTCTNP